MADAADAAEESIAQGDGVEAQLVAVRTIWDAFAVRVAAFLTPQSQQIYVASSDYWRLREAIKIWLRRCVRMACRRGRK